MGSFYGLDFEFTHSGTLNYLIKRHIDICEHGENFLLKGNSLGGSFKRLQDSWVEVLSTHHPHQEGQKQQVDNHTWNRESKGKHLNSAKKWHGTSKAWNKVQTRQLASPGLAGSPVRLSSVEKAKQEIPSDPHSHCDSCNPSHVILVSGALRLT